MARTVARGLQFHKPEFAVACVETECSPYEQRCRHYPESYAHTLVDACHIHYHEDYEQCEKSAGEDEQILALEALELRTAAYPLIDCVLCHNQRKNERRIVAATIRKMQAPNHEAAVLDVSGSPDENLE